MDKVRIAIVANAAFTILNFRFELIELLVAEGIKVLVVCPATCGLMEGRDIAAEFSKMGVEFHPVDMVRSGTNPIKDLGYLRRLYQLFKKESPDYVLNYTIKPTIYSSIAARMAGATVCSNITGIGYALTSRALKGKLVSTFVVSLYRLALRFNRSVFFQNPDDMGFFIEKGLVCAERAVVLNGSGINTDVFRRKRVFPAHCSFIFVGRLLRDKGIFEFIGAAKKFSAIYPSVRFSVVGQLDDNPESLSKNELRKLSDGGVIDYLGAVSDVRPLLEQHQVLVLPSYREGTPRSVLEAMSLSMPIITTDAPGCRETVVDGENGYLAAVQDENSLFLCMKKMFENQHLLKDMGRKSRQIALKKYDVTAVNQLILSTLMNGASPLRERG